MTVGPSNSGGGGEGEGGGGLHNGGVVRTAGSGEQHANLHTLVTCNTQHK